jgi:hypothetical protein
MSGILKTIKEYTDVVVKGIQNGDKIIEAMMNSAKVKNGKISTEALAEILRRKDICAACPFNSLNATKDGSYVSSLNFQHCVLCKCTIGGEDTKEYCLSCNCGAEAFNKMNPHLPKIEVRWKAIEIETNSVQ